MATEHSIQPPPALVALRVTSQEMFPRFLAGEYVLYEETDDAAPGDEVVLVMRDGSTKIRKLVERTDSRVRVAMYSPSSVATFEASSISTIHPVVGCRKEPELAALGFVPESELR
ncbi:helix-turn-helix transcriptional regulator [Paraburkholderia sp. B3]|uniref:S24 family peptidase n=1 Tax=Paraburkholderia sp. B3 TaxID=3134791 RepID=UPI0039820408